MKRNPRGKSAATTGTRKKTAARVRARTAAASERPAAAKKRAVTLPRAKAAPKEAPARNRASARKPAVAKTAARVRQPRRRIASAPAPATATAAALHWTDTLRDGTHVVVRPIRSQDTALERRFIERLSPESRRMRFLGQIGSPSEELLRHLTDIDYGRDMAFIALVHRDNEKQEIGVSRYSCTPEGTSCECAVTVSDEWHHKGLATLLMRHLIDVARARGIRTMVSYDAIDNGEMRDLATFLGFERKPDPQDPGMVVHRLSL